MNIKPFKSRLLAFTGGAVVVALAAGGVAYATAPSTASPSATAKPGVAATATPALRFPALRRDVRYLVRHTVHAELVVKLPGGYKTVDVDRGTLTSVSNTSITLTRPDGPMVSATITPQTRFFGLPEAKLSTGDRVIVVQTGGNAVLVGARAPQTGTTAAS